MGSQTIKCNVASCKYNDNSHACSLSDINVGHEPPSNEAKRKTDTLCSSFETNLM
ncbi:MAG: DUF1540 domain-containing protein [Clostridiales bacterium]|jgi:hypothetical protein|nr:DUF1540 domain-containing protein [Clostridiales bacterium]